MNQGDLFAPRPQPSPASVPVECKREARDAIRHAVGELHDRIVAELAKWSDGATAEELERATGIGGSTMRPRLLELLANGRARRTGEKRRTNSGRNASVWKVA